MATTSLKPSVPKELPPANSDFYQFTDLLSDEERAVVQQTRAFMDTKVAPITTRYWTEDATAAGLYKGEFMMAMGTARQDVTAYAFGAHFVEVRVHSRTCEIRVPRVVSAFAAGTIINLLAAHSQLMGGAIWGLSSALHEPTELDLAAARYVNDNLADYLIPVNADVPSIDIIMVPERDDRVNPLGIKGVGELGIVGMNAAVANAVFNATGKRVRALPIRSEKLL